MLRKWLYGALIAAGLMFVATPSADAGWRGRALRHGYYPGGGYGYYYAPRRAYRNQYYYNSYPGYYYGSGYYGNSGYYSYPGYYYGSYGYGPGAGVYTPWGGVYVR